MLKIKLTRIGKKKQAYYRIVVAEAKSKRDGKFVAQLGTYNPLSNPKTFSINKKLLADWQQKGAQPTETVLRLIKKHA